MSEQLENAEGVELRVLLRGLVLTEDERARLNNAVQLAVLHELADIDRGPAAIVLRGPVGRVGETELPPWWRYGPWIMGMIIDTELHALSE